MAPTQHFDGPTKSSRALVGITLGLIWGFILVLLSDKSN